ncbi:MAG: VWA domain-containing protein [Acidobacteria bacterium]|nr:MAG: VWA domain-containing protein [Acidobacteriota bacterium]
MAEWYSVYSEPEGPFMRNQSLRVGASWYVLAAAMVLISAAPRADGHAAQKTRTIYASITDKAGAPAANLAPADITVREDGQAREVVSIKAASAPMAVAFLVDNSHVAQAMTAEIRLGATSFVSTLLKLSPDSTISLATFGDRPTPVRDFTSSVPVLTKDTGRIFAVSGSGSYLLDAIVDASKAFKKMEAPRKAIVAFVDESGEEFSNAVRQQVFDAVKASGASVWIVVLQGNGAATESTEGRDRSAVIGDLPRQSGGTTLTILNKQGLNDKMKHLASLMANQFEITYGRPDQLIPPSKLEVTVGIKNLTVAAPRWTNQ